MDRYEPLLTQVEQLFPGGTEHVVTRDGKFEFAAYLLSSKEGGR
jgi:hypothetical protein